MNTNYLVYLLFAFIGIGLFSDRLGKKWTWALMTLVILAYVIYLYRH